MHEINWSSKAREIENDFDFFLIDRPQYCPFDGIQINSQCPIFHVEVPSGIGKGPYLYIFWTSQQLLEVGRGGVQDWWWCSWGQDLVQIFFFCIVN
jgi:hypothetical protein